ncbi:MAG: type II/IV secretion system protein [Epsilonproteobacteria bacterium]|nr:type II/IV secretion system protein [Campylobacterota bacterium]
MIKNKIRLGDLLEEKGLITKEQLQKALAIQQENSYNKKLGEILVNEGYIEEKELAQILANQLGLEFIDLFSVEIDFSLFESYPINLFKNADAIVFKEDENFVHIAIADPLNYDAIELFEKHIAVKPIKLYVATKSEIKHIFERFEIIQTTKSLIESVKRDIQSGSLKNENEQSSVMKLIEQIIKNAVFNNASDIHIEPSTSQAVVRNRIDGVLRESFIFEKEVYNALTSRIKILGNLDISERRKAQDGRFSLQISQKSYDFRLSTVPTLYGESIVLRILDQQKALLKLNELGFNKKNLKKMENFLNTPYGIVFVTGPTGSGKTTTLYAALNEIKGVENKAITIEDPIEYRLPLIQQIQVNEKIGFTFSHILRSVLRQDPDIIMVGEARDYETLNAAVQASLTGHLVFSTLHTNDAPSAITRMVQMGLEPYLIADSLIGIVSQRLARKICPYCKTKYRPHRNILEKVEKYLPKNVEFYKGEGCAKCMFTGYSGRIVISEILENTNLLSHLISSNANKFEIVKEAKKEGYAPMIIDGLRKSLMGITTLEEVLRVVKVS